MSLIESNDILKNICSHAYYRGDEIFRAIQCLAEGKTITRIWTLEDSGKTVIDEKLKDRLMKSKDKGNAFDDVNWAWLLSLLLFLSTLEPPKRREITISAKSNGKSVVITYDPSDAEAVKAVEAWRGALFVKTSEAAPRNGNCIYASDKVRYALDAIAYLSGNVKGQYTYIPLTAKQRKAIDTLYEDLHSREPLDAANLFKPGSYEPKDLPPEHEKASKPQDERRVTCDSKKPAETVKWGHWEKSSVPCEKYVCSECGGAFCGDNGTQPRYCHNCGARMENATTFAIKPAAGTAKHESATSERIADTDDFDTLKALVENALTALNRAATEVSRKSEYDKEFHTGVLFAKSLLKEFDEDLARWHRECQTRKK